MEIGLFQLENLFYTHTRFCFLDLRVKTEPSTHSALENILARSEKVAANRVESYLSDAKIPKEAPIVLICENGRQSAAVTQKLETVGYANVYVVEGGVEALLREL